MIDLFNWVKLHKFPSKSILELIKIPERYYYLMKQWHEIKAPTKFSYLDDISFDSGDSHAAKMENYLDDWFNLVPVWKVTGCYVYQFDSIPPKEINSKYISSDALCLRYYAYCLIEQPLFALNQVDDVPLCLYLGFTPINYNADSDALNNAFRICKFQDDYLNNLRFDYEVTIEWNQWIKEILSLLSKQYS